MITHAQLVEWFTYHPPENDEQIQAYQELRDAGKAFAEVVLRLVPPSADQSDAIRKIREAVMTSNAGLACKGV